MLAFSTKDADERTGRIARRATFSAYRSIVHFVMKQGPLNLPKPIADYFSAEKKGAEAVCRCFSENAVVKDEAQSYKGSAAIKQWRTEVASKYEFTSEPFACEEKDGKIVVTSRLTGNFPGSPVDLRVFFELQGDKIASLEIIS